MSVQATEETATPIPSPTDAPPISVTATPSTQPEEESPTPEVEIEGIEVPILLYHHISVPEGGDSAVGYEYFVSPADFETQMAYLEENNYTPIDLYDLYEAVQDDSIDLPDKPVIITFDDGYIDLYENAFPILQDFGFTATFFMITDFVEEEREGYMTWEMVEEMAEAGMRFESHSRSHADLRGQTNDFLVRQVLESQEALTQHIGYTPRFLAYPYGQYDENLIQFLEENGFWGGLTAQGGLIVGLENRFTWPRLYIPADTPPDTFTAVLGEGQTITYQPEIIEGTTSFTPMTVTVTISTSQGVITAPSILVYDEELNSDWTIKTSPDVQIDLEYGEDTYNGDVSLSYTPNEDLGSFFLQVRPNPTQPYLRDDIVGLSFWLYTGEDPLAPDDLAVIVTGSNEFPYWTAVDESVDPDEYEPTFEDDRFGLDFNQVIEASTWVQVIIYLDDLAYDTDYLYITGLNLVNNIDVSRTFLIDELVLILRDP